MHRTNIYLTDEQERLLEARARDEGVSKSEIIRRILDRALGLGERTADPVAAAKAAYGLWADRSEDEMAELGRWRRVDRFDRLGL
jgi:hypothetical protein